MAKTTGYFKEKNSDFGIRYIGITPNEAISVMLYEHKSRIDIDDHSNFYAKWAKESGEPITKQQFLSAIKEAIEPINKYIKETVIEQSEYESREIKDSKNA